MIEVEGYKAFHGTMQITPRQYMTPFQLTGDWLYKPEFWCWYCKGRSFPCEICKIIKDSPEDEKIYE